MRETHGYLNFPKKFRYLKRHAADRNKHVAEETRENASIGCQGSASKGHKLLATFRPAGDWDKGTPTTTSENP